MRKRKRLRQGRWVPVHPRRVLLDRIEELEVMVRAGLTDEQTLAASQIIARRRKERGES